MSRFLIGLGTIVLTSNFSLARKGEGQKEMSWDVDRLCCRRAVPNFLPLRSRPERPPTALLPTGKKKKREKKKRAGKKKTPVLPKTSGVSPRARNGRGLDRPDSGGLRSSRFFQVAPSPIKNKMDRKEKGKG